MTYCHDQTEWENLLQKTDCLCDLKKLEEGSVKRKLYQGKCEECLRNQKFLFTANYKDISKLVNVMLKSLKRKQLKKMGMNENKKKGKNKRTKKTVPVEGKPSKRKSQLQNSSTSLPTESKPSQCVVVSKAPNSPKRKEIIIKSTSSSKSNLSATMKTGKERTLETQSKPINNSSVTIEKKLATPKMNSNLLTDRALTISNLHSPISSGIHHSKHHHHSPRKCMNLSSTKPLDVIDFSTSQLRDLLQQSRHPPQVVPNPPMYHATFPNKISPVKITSISPLKQTFITPLINPVEAGQKIFSNNLHFATQTNDKSTKQQLILPKPASFNQPIHPIASNILKPINVPKPPNHDAIVDCKQISNPFKKELLLVQVREYLRKHPDAVNYSPSPSVTSQAPCVYLSNGFTQPQQNKTASPLAFRAMLPEHLWKDLINAGIAQHELEEIVLNSNAVKQKFAKVVTTTPTANVQSLVNAFQTTIDEAQHHSMNSHNILSSQGNNLYLNSQETLKPTPGNNLINYNTQSTLQSLPANNLMTLNSHNIMQPVPGNKLIKSNHQHTLQTFPINNSKNFNPLNNMPMASRSNLVNANFQSTSNKLPGNNSTNLLQQSADSITINSLNSSIRALQTIKSNLLLQSNKTRNSPESSLQIAPIAQERIMSGASSQPSNIIPASNISNVIHPNIVKPQPLVKQPVVKEQPVKQQFMKSYYNQLVSSLELSSRTSFVTNQGNTSNQQHNVGKKIFISKPIPNNSISSFNPSSTTTITPSPKKKNKRIKLATQSDDEQDPHKLVADCESSQGKTQTVVSAKDIHPPKEKNQSSQQPPPTTTTTTNKSAKGKVQQVFETCLDNEVDLNSIVGNEFIEKHFDLIDDEEYFFEEKKNKKRRNYHEMLKEFFAEEEKKAREEEETDLLFVITNEDGLKLESSSLQGQYCLFLL